MGFTQLGTAKSKTLHIPKLSKGLCYNSNPHITDDAALADCKNIWFREGLLTTRPALYTKVENVLNHGDFTQGSSFLARTEKLEIVINSEPKYLVSERIDYDISAYFCLTHLLNSDGTPYSTAVLSFNRVSDEVFYIPRKINFFKGRPQTGCGIFALVNLVNCENITQSTAGIYELDLSYSNWEQCYSPYIPTVLINGRGNKYELAKQTGQAFTGSPTRIEGLNILNGSFYAYFSTDGCSSSFRLPFGGLADKNVVCRLYYSVEDYTEWVIYEGTTTATATLYNVSVTANVNREKGIVYFTVPAGEYEVPLITDRNENNLRITAVKQSEYSVLDVTDCDCTLESNNKIILGSKNLIFVADYNNPLYFPLQSVGYIGSEDCSITALAPLKNSVAVFKEKGIFTLTVNRGKAINSVSLLADNPTVFYESDDITFQCTDYNVGCNMPSSVISCDGRIFWQDSGVFYSLSSSKGVTAYDFKHSLLNPSAKLIGVENQKSNLFFSGNKAVIMDENQSWYYWEFPQKVKIIGAFYTPQGAMLLCKCSEDNLFYTAFLNGQQDIVINTENYDTATEACAIESIIRTQRLSLGCSGEFKSVNLITLAFEGEADVRVNDRLEAKIGGLASHRLKAVRLTAGLSATNTVDISISARKPVSLGSIDIKYTTLEL